MSEQFPKRTIRSYVLRQGRMTVAQTRALEVLWPKFGLEPEGVFDFAKIFGNSHPVVIEIGFGMGSSLVEMAALNPDLNYIGIEVHGPGVGACLDAIEKRDISNLRIIQHDAVEILNEHITNGSVGGFQIFFPDPWHKKRHHKRRLIQPDFVKLLVSKLANEGFLHLATDWENYAEQMMEVLSGNVDIVNKMGENAFAKGCELRPSTKFEARGQRLGHGVWDLLFTKK